MHIKDFDPFDFNKKEISNVPIYYKHLPWSPCIHIRIVFNSGAFSDPIGKEGVAHFLEHMFFKGSKKFPNEKIINDWSLKNTINSFNASTNLDYTYFSLRCLPEKFRSNFLSGPDGYLLK